MNIILFNGYEIDNLSGLNVLIQENDCEVCRYAMCVPHPQGGCSWRCSDKNCFINGECHGYDFAGIKEMKVTAE